jgi:ribonuclease HI
MNDVIIYTDGSVSGNGKETAVGGWATILQAIIQPDSYTCLNCNYTGKLASFDDTEHDGDVLGTCPKCDKNGTIMQEEKEVEIEKCGKLTYETDCCAVTNNRAEMYAILKGLESIVKPCRIKVYSDSELCIKTLNGEYARKTNLDLWEQMDREIAELNKMGCKILFQWVKGHANDELNNRCDKMASKVKKGEIPEKG